MLFAGGAGLLFLCCRDASEDNEWEHPSEVIDKPTDSTAREPPALENIIEPPTPNGCPEQLESL
jgi:hypothetical protein